MAKCANDCNGEAGSDLEWFKTHEWGFEPNEDKTRWDTWASSKLAASVATEKDIKLVQPEVNKVHHSFALPTGLPKGNYLVRDNIIGEARTSRSISARAYFRYFPISFA
jgi:hypothetical protein